MEIGGAGAVVVVRPKGELDLAAASALREALLTALARTTDEVVVDCSGVTFIDSTVLGVLAAASKRLRASGHHLRVTNATPTVARAITIAGLSDYLCVDPSGNVDPF